MPSMLAIGGACTLDDLRQHVAVDIASLLSGLDNDTLPGRRAKVEAQVKGGGGHAQGVVVAWHGMEWGGLSGSSSPTTAGCALTH